MKYNYGWKISDEDMNELLESYGEHHNKVIMSKDSNIAEYEKHLMVCEEVEKWMKACGVVPNIFMIEARKPFI